MTDNFIKILSEEMSQTQTEITAKMMARGLGVTAYEVLPGQERRLPRDLPVAIRMNDGQKIIDGIGFNFNTEPNWFDECVKVLQPKFSSAKKEDQTIIFFLVGENDNIWYIIPPF